MFLFTLASNAFFSSSEWLIRFWFYRKISKWARVINTNEKQQKNMQKKNRKNSENISKQKKMQTALKVLNKPIKKFLSIIDGLASELGGLAKFNQRFPFVPLTRLSFQRTKVLFSNKRM